MNGVLPADALALRAEGRDAARSGRPLGACPYQRGDWRLLEWHIGHIGFGGPVSPALVHRAYNARRRAVRRREREMAAVARPETNGRICKLAACPRPVPWKAGISRARNAAREFCCPEHQHAHQAATAAERRDARAAADPKGARRREREAARRRRAREAKSAAPVAAETPPPPAPALRPGVITDVMWRAACTGMSEVEMRRFVGLDDAQVAKVLELQRRSGRVAA